MTKPISKRTGGHRTHGLPFKKTMLAMCVGAALQPAAWAQTESEESASAQVFEELEEVTVYGVRSSLKSAQDLKRNADTHVDAISASDLGSLPDVSVLEALQRVPGISIERFEAADDTDRLSSEGASISLRGLPYTRSEFNGRDSFSADSGRGLSFRDVPPELLESVEVFKNHTADQIEGGISGTINLNTRKPFDTEERKFSFGITGNYGSLEKEFSGGVSGLYSDRFETANGEFGVLVSYSDTELDFRSDGVEFGLQNLIEDAAGAGQDRYVPANAGIRTLSTNRVREGGSLVLQYENSDQTFSAVAEYVRSDASIDWRERAFFSDDASPNGAGAGADARYDDSNFIGGTLTGLGGAFGPSTRRQFTTNLVEELSLQLEFEVNDRLRVSTELQAIEAERAQEDLSLFGSLIDSGNARVEVLSNGDVPRVRFLAPVGSTQTDAEFFSDPTNFFYRGAMEHLDDAVADETSIRADAEYALNTDFFESVQFGVRFAERDQTTRWSQYNWQNVSESWAGGFADLSGTVGPRGYAVAGASAFNFDGFHNGEVNALPGNTTIFGPLSAVSGYENFLATFPVRSGPNLADREGVIAGTNYLPAEVVEANEQNSSIYVRLNFGADGSRYSGNFGLRYVNIDSAVAGGSVFPQAFNANIIPFLPANVVAFANGFNDPADAQSSYDDILPSLNVRYEIDDDQLIRFGLAKAIALPNVGDLRYNYSIGGPGIDTTEDADGNITSATLTSNFTQTSGNPFLEPVEAINVDLSYENYFAEDGYYSVGVFYKDLSNFISLQAVDQLVTNPSNGAEVVVTVNQPINIADASLSGIEFSYQQFFDSLPGLWSGLGMQANYTYLNPSDIPQQSLRSVAASTVDDISSVVTEGLPLQSLSENQFNIVGIYQNDKLEARLAYNWRDEYLLTPRNVINRLPAFQEARGQLDGSFTYNLTDQLQIILQATNLLESETRVVNQIDNEGNRTFRSAFAADRRYSLQLRGNF